jgi:ADP-ribosylation factor-like protein 2
MGLLKIIRKVKRREREMRLLMLGLDNAGKTTVLYRFIDEDISDIPPTVGFNIRTVAEYFPTDKTSRSFRLNIYDVGGQRSIRSFWRNYLEQTDGLIWVVDSADIFRLTEDCKEELNKLLKEERLAGASLLILANKQDLDGALSAAEIADALELHKIQATGRHCAVFPCSAWEADKSSVNGGIEWLVADIAARVYRQLD